MSFKARLPCRAVATAGQSHFIFGEIRRSPKGRNLVPSTTVILARQEPQLFADTKSSDTRPLPSSVTLLYHNLCRGYLAQPSLAGQLHGLEQPVVPAKAGTCTPRGWHYHLRAYHDRQLVRSALLEHLYQLQNGPNRAGTVQKQKNRISEYSRPLVDK